MAVIVDGDFPGGGVEDVRIIPGRNAGEDAVISFAAPIGGIIFNEEAMWFYFRVRGAKGKRLTFIQRNMYHVLGGAEYGAVRPVVREGSGGEYWRVPLEDTLFVPDPICHSFRVTPGSDEIYISFCFPYQYAELEAFAAKHSGKIELRFIGKTGQGRDYPVLIAGDNGDKNKTLVVVSARQHAGETPGSFVLEGFIEEYLGDGDGAKSLRDKTVLVILPMVNLDGVETGKYGKNSYPEDFARAWYTGTSRVEIRHFLDFIEEKIKIYKAAFYADFHAPGPAHPSYILPGLPKDGIERWKKVNQLIDLFEELTKDRGVCKRDSLDPGFINWSGDNFALTMRAFCASAYGFDTVSLESGYQADADGRYLYPEDWRFTGRKFCEAVRRVWFEGFAGYPIPETDAADEWESWERRGPTENAEVTIREGALTAESSGGGRIFFSDRKKITSGEKGAYTIVCKGRCDMVCFAYYYKEGKTAKKGKLFSVSLCNEEMKFPYLYFSRKEYDSFTGVFRLLSFSGSFQVEHGSL
jgi:hypothetical protein